MVKRLLAVMLVLALGFGMAACDGDSNGPPTDLPVDEPDENTSDATGLDTSEGLDASKLVEGTTEE